MDKKSSIMKKVLVSVFVFIFLIVAYVIYANYPKLNIITGFAAKNVCSCTFEAGRDLNSIETGDNDFGPVFYAENMIDTNDLSVESTVFGLKKRKAVYEEGVGCILLPPDTKRDKIDIPKPNRSLSKSLEPYPYGRGEHIDTAFSDVNYGDLQLAVEQAFDTDREKSRRTRAVVVLYKGRLITEKYAPEFNRNTKLLGWSMTKSITNAVMGVLEKQGGVSLSQNNLFKEWETDERSKITLNDMLQMNSGLEWEEDYERISDVTRMLFLEKNMPSIQLHKPLVAEPGSIWNYSSGTSNLLSQFIRDQFDTQQEYLDFWYTNFIDKIGMNSMTLETDPDGNYVGSSYCWGTARDWAKFGLLYLNRGNWNGEQILNESWVDYSATPVENSHMQYGAHFWLNAGGKYPNLPRDLYSSNGFQGQYVFIIPSKDLVVVRFGLTEEPQFDVDEFLSGILSATGKPSGSNK